MADVTYVESSREFVRIPVTVSEAITLGDWTGAIAFTKVNDIFDADTATWISGTLVAGADSLHFTVRVMQGVSPILTPGTYVAHVRLTHSPDTTDYEKPIIKASGKLKVE